MILGIAYPSSAQDAKGGMRLKPTVDTIEASMRLRNMIGIVDKLSNKICLLLKNCASLP